MGDMQAWQQELELERMAIESAIVKRIEQGTATAKDAIERCAKEADAYVSDGNQYARHAGRAVARRIRALAEKVKV